jgi:N-methylhydantoinase B/oxoprolinase/acetone carboxylase alpha subunit
LQRGDRVSLNPSGSGGYGRPAERDRQAVIDDVLDGYVSRESAVRDYGVRDLPESS